MPEKSSFVKVITKQKSPKNKCNNLFLNVKNLYEKLCVCVCVCLCSVTSIVSDSLQLYAL